MTASCSVTRELAELVVGDEPALPRAELLHAREQFALRAPRRASSPSSSALIRIESMPLFLPSTIAALGADELGGVRLDRRRIVELARDRAALAAEEVLADERLARLELVAGELAAAARRTRAPARGAGSSRRRRAPRSASAISRRFALPARSPMPLTVPVDPARARTHGGDGGRRREPEVVVAVEVHGIVRRRATRACVRPGRRPPPASRCRSCRRRRPPARPPRPRSCRRSRRRPGRRAGRRRRRTPTLIPCSTANETA